MSDKGKEKKMKPSGNDSCSKRGKTVLKKNVELNKVLIYICATVNLKYSFRPVNQLTCISKNALTNPQKYLQGIEQNLDSSSFIVF